MAFDSLLVSDLEELVAIGASVAGTEGVRSGPADPVRYVISATFSEHRGVYARRGRAH